MPPSPNQHNWLQLSGQNTNYSYFASLECSFSEFLESLVPASVLELTFSFGPFRLDGWWRNPHNWHNPYLSSPRLDLLCTDDRLRIIVSSLHDCVRASGEDNFQWGGLFKDNHSIHRGQSRQDSSAFISRPQSGGSVLSNSIQTNHC